MKLLGIDTSTENCSVALLNEDKLTFKSQLAPQKHAEILLDMIDSLLKENSVTKDELTGLVLGSGPGSFTGVRIAASTVQGLALGLNLKVARVTSLEALAYEALSENSSSYVVSSLDARMGEVYVAVYEVKEKEPVLMDEEKVLKPDAGVDYIKSLLGGSDDFICAGSGIKILQSSGLKNKSCLCELPVASYLMHKGEILFKEGKIVDPEQALPLYVRNEVTWKKIGEQ